MGTNDKSAALQTPELDPKIRQALEKITDLNIAATPPIHDIERYSATEHQALKQSVDREIAYRKAHQSGNPIGPHAPRIGDRIAGEILIADNPAHHAQVEKAVTQLLGAETLHGHKVTSAEIQGLLADLGKKGGSDKAFAQLSALITHAVDANIDAHLAPSQHTPGAAPPPAPSRGK